MSNLKPSNKSSQASRLFSTLAFIDRVDASAAKRRKKYHSRSLRQSRAAGDQARLNGILLELRILTERCLAEEQEQRSDRDNSDGSTKSDNSNSRVEDEVDALLENLLMARRELMGHQLDDSTQRNDDQTSGNTNDFGYAKLIQQAKKKKIDGNYSINDAVGDSTDTGACSTSGSYNNNTDSNNLAKLLQSEYASLVNYWKSSLNKQHSDLALHSGMSANNSKFQSKAVDVSFWEQVQAGTEHERFKQRSALNNTKEEGAIGHRSLELYLQFDDSKLYQQMLKDFISSSQNNGLFGTTKVMLDPAQEAMGRLRRAMNKKYGGTGDVDLTSFLTEGSATSSGGLISQKSAMKKQAASTMDRRASKGRKIRYTVYPKLVNFTFPVARKESLIGEDIWFKSMFGGAGGRNNL